MTHISGNVVPCDARTIVRHAHQMRQLHRHVVGRAIQHKPLCIVVRYWKVVVCQVHEKHGWRANLHQHALNHPPDHRAVLYFDSHGNWVRVANRQMCMIAHLDQPTRFMVNRSWVGYGPPRTQVHAEQHRKWVRANPSEPRLFITRTNKKYFFFIFFFCWYQVHGKGHGTSHELLA